MDQADEEKIIKIFLELHDKFCHLSLNVIKMILEKKQDESENALITIYTHNLILELLRINSTEFMSFSCFYGMKDQDLENYIDFIYKIHNLLIDKFVNHRKEFSLNIFKQLIIELISRLEFILNSDSEDLNELLEEFYFIGKSR